LSLERVGLGRARTGDAVEAQAIGVRVALEQSGLDHGPISVPDKMKILGMSPVPSTAALLRIFREAGVAWVEPRKKPRASFRRFVYLAPNACWQLDGIEYVLTGGRKCVIFQLIDDHARLAIATHVAWGETSEGAIVVVKKGIAAHGVPQRLLTDNGAVLNPSRRGAVDQIDNTERPHQGLPGRITPQEAWEATSKADPPRPRNQIRPVGWDGIRRTTVAVYGIVQVRQTRFHVTRLLAGQSVYLIETDQHLIVFDDQGTELMRCRWPRPGTKYVGSGRRKGPRGPRKTG